MKKKKNISLILTALALAVIIPCCMSALKVYGYTPSCQEENYRAGELVEQGYEWAMAVDQAAEEFGREGPYGTGGFDGKLLNGQPAPNAGKTRSQIVNEDSGTNDNPGAGATSKETHTHKWVIEDMKDATCVEEGYINYICSECSKTKTEKVPVTDHDLLLESEEEGNCSKYSVFHFVCTVCGEKVDETGELGDHNFVLSEDSVAATCTEGGYEKKVCSVCGKEEEGPTDPAGHTYSANITIMEEATCTKDGSKGYVCSVCGDVKDFQVIPAKGHAPGEPVREEAGLFKTGTIHTYCTTCHSLLEEEIIPAKVNPVVPAVIFVVIVAIVAVVVFKKKAKK